MSNGLTNILKIALGGVIATGAVLSGSLVSAGMVNNAGKKPRRNPTINTAIIANPIDPPLTKMPLVKIPCKASKTKPKAANMPISAIVFILFDVFFIFPP
jgi:hypothetical protein